jgi:hypothetical protein
MGMADIPGSVDDGYVEGGSRELWRSVHVRKIAERNQRRIMGLYIESGCELVLNSHGK